MALAREDHRHAVSIGDADQLRVATRAARLNDRGDAGIGGTLDRVGEREKAIRGKDRPRGTLTSLAQRKVDRILATRLTGAEADQRQTPRQNDAIRGHVLDRAP